MEVLALLRTLLSRFLLLLFMVAYLPILLICLCIPQKILLRSKLFAIISRFFYWYLMKCSFLPITIIGKENIPNQPVIIASNHQSSLDIPIIGWLIDYKPHVWLATIDLLKSPILRFVIPRVAVIVDMTTPLKGMRSLLQVIEISNNDSKMNIMIFPEGARYSDGAIHDFFSGFVILAKKTDRPVVPVRLFGLDKAYPKNSFIVYRVPIKAIVGKPMRYEANDTDETFKQRVYNWFCEQKED